uniref:Uncharacterized protein n=1 Tax=Lepeophtheirus salmonis TaxID=72036 RepID=A0A0K2U8K6_LEPSM
MYEFPSLTRCRFDATSFYLCLLERLTFSWTISLNTCYS